jgi:hypothetical protein
VVGAPRVPRPARTRRARRDRGRTGAARGEIDADLQPTGKTKTAHSACGGKPYTGPGHEYVGTIGFHGEDGYTDAAATRTPLLLSPLLNIVCNVSSEGESFGGGVHGVRIKPKRVAGPSLQINQDAPGAHVHYFSRISERHGDLRIERAVEGDIGAGALRFDPALDHAHFTGGGPFSGTATYSSTSPPTGTRPGHGTWSGNLTVDYPGRPSVRLAGPSFPAAIIHAELFK